MPEYDGWELLRDDKDPRREKTLGSGGQGTVYLARSLDRAAKRRQAHERARSLLEQVNRGRYEPMELATCLLQLTEPDPVESLGALKQFKIPADDKDEEARAISRLESEIRALNTVKHPAVLKLLCANASQRFIVTQYHRNGSLNDNLHLYRGNVLAALRAFRSLVDGVVEIHAQGAVHRDIKPANIFVVESGDLVLGDFGIVFFHTGSSETRVTKTVGELVGSHWWMPPWAYMYDRIEMDKVSPSFDIYPLAKVLWSMISGRNGFMREEYEEDDNNLEKIFQNDPLVRLVNGFLATCVVRKEKNCINFALGLRSQVDALISQINERHGDRPDASQPWPCRMCGRGKYRATTTILLGQIPGGAVNDRNPFSVYVCDNVNCRHAELFRTN